MTDAKWPALKSLSTAMAKGFFRDKMALFFSSVFPLMFLVLFGGIFTNQGVSRSGVIQVGPVTVLDQAPAKERAVLGDSLKITKSADLKTSIAKIRKGGADAVIQQDGDKVIIHFSKADQVTSAVVQGTFQAIVQCVVRGRLRRLSRS